MNQELTAGVNVAWSRPGAATYDGHQYEYVLVGPGKIVIPVAVDGVDLVVNVNASVTSTWSPGLYQWALFAALGDDRYQLDSGKVTVSPGVSQLAAGHDPRSHDEKMLDAIKSTLEGRAVKDVESYTIENRTLNKIPILELHRLEKVYQARVNQARRKASGKSNKPKAVRVRFRR